MVSAVKQVVIVGGGVVGAACAHHLVRAGLRVTVVEKDRFGAACSHANCGLISPSHVLPLAEPGVLGLGLSAMFAANAPLMIKPRWSWDLWQWLVQFGLRCNHQDMIESAIAIQALLNSSRGLYEQMLESEGFDCDWQKRGGLFVYRTRGAFEKFGEVNRLLTEVLDAGHRRIEPDELAVMEPALKPGLAGAWFYEQDAHLRPDRLMANWKEKLRGAGVEILEQCEFRGFIARNERVAAVQTSRGEFAADHVVVAAGALTPFLQEHLGCKVPIQPGKGYSLTMSRPRICPTHPLLFPEHRVAVTPWQSGYRLGSIMELAGYDATLHPERLELLRGGARDYLHEPYCEPVVEKWFGWRPLTWDSRPIIDRTPLYENCLIAAGHNMLGLSMAPATGKLAMELITGRQPHINPRPYRLARFQTI
ncbi:MAG: FAD-dependent oxidoreductase [Pirellulales bacterium]|nr:FAD-dependent oxidoreductase [Pirellulales bacterium]